MSSRIQSCTFALLAAGPLLFTQPGLPISAFAQDAPTVGLVLPMPEGGNPFIDSIAEAARSKASELGYNLVIRSAATSADTAGQVMIARDMLTQNYDGIIVLPGEPAAFTDFADLARSAGTIVIGLDRPIPGSSITVESSGFAAGVAVGQWAKGAILGDGSKGLGVLDFGSFPFEAGLKEGIVAGIGSPDPSIFCDVASQGDPAAAIDGLFNTCANIAAIVTPDPLAGVEALTAVKQRGSDVAVLSLGNGCGSLTDMLSGDGPDITMFERPGALSTIALDQVAEFIKGGKVVPDGQQTIDTGVDLIAKTMVADVPALPLDGVPEFIFRRCEIENNTQCCTEKDKSCCPKPR
jgi:ABC-type sugar transport system substrate-binding protein